MWKAEEGDLNSPRLQSQRASLPQLQKDPLQLQLDMDTLIVEVGANTPLLEVRPWAAPVADCSMLQQCDTQRRRACPQAQALNADTLCSAA